MKTLIIALLFRVTISKKSIKEKIDYILFLVEDLLLNPDFNDAISLPFVNALKAAALAAKDADVQAESKATADIKAKDTALKQMDRLYKKMVVHAEEICGDDEEKAKRSGIIMRKKRAKKNASQPQNLRAKTGKLIGEIEARCKSLGPGFTYLWYIRKEGDKEMTKPESTTKANVTFTGLESGVLYEMIVQAKTSTDKSEASDVATARAK